jgi:hypothetical protein
MIMEDSPDTIRTVYHEAGHAVAHYIFRVPFIKISIVPGEDYNGIVNGDGNYINKLTEDIGGICTSDTWALKRMDNNIKVLLAGYAAEEVYLGNRIGIYNEKYGTPPDVLAAFEILLRLGYMDLNEPFRKYYEDTVILLREKQNREAVELLASILIGARELSGRKAREIIRRKISMK